MRPIALSSVVGLEDWVEGLVTGRCGSVGVVSSHTQSLSLSVSQSLGLWDERFQEQLVVTLLPPLILTTPAHTAKLHRSGQNKPFYVEI